MQYTLSAIDAAKFARCSLRCIITHCKKGSFDAIQVPSPTRLAWRINKQSFKKFQQTHIKGNRRYHRYMPKASYYEPFINKGYRYVKQEGHARANFAGYVPEHVLVMEEKIQRKLRKGEEVHHINGIKLDNRPENLELYRSRGEHHKKGHGRSQAIKMKLMHLLKKEDFDPAVLTIEQKAELFDSLVKDTLS